MALSMGAVALTVSLAATGCFPASGPSSSPSTEQPQATATPEASPTPSDAAAQGEPSADAPSAPGVPPVQTPGPVAAPAPTQWPGIQRSIQRYVPRATAPAPASVPGPSAAQLVEIPAVPPPPSPAPLPDTAQCTTPPFVPAPAPEYGTNLLALPLDVVPEWDIHAPDGLDAQAAVEWWAANGGRVAAERAQKTLDAAAVAADDAERQALLSAFLADGLREAKILGDRISAYWTIDYGIPFVTRAAQAALDSGDPEVIADFLRRGQYAAAVEGVAATARGAVLRAAEDALAAGTREALMEFLRTGMLPAQATNDRQSVYALLTTASPSVYAAAQDALSANDPLVIAEFLRTGQYAAAALDACA